MATIRAGSHDAAPGHGQTVLRPFARIIEGWGLRQVTVAGVVGAALIAIGSIGAGALPANDPSRLIPVLSFMRHGTAGLRVALTLYYAGLMTVIVAWLLLGRLLITGSTRGERAEGAAVDPAGVRRIATWWLLPLLMGMPIASMDLYSYAAQAQIAHNGLDPYTFTPADLPGKFLDNVSGHWVDTPSPYGPLWVAVSRIVAEVIGNHALATALILRLIPCLALLVIARLLPGIAARFGQRGDLAVWLAVANPLVLVHGVGGGHNDIVMMALALAGTAVVTRPSGSASDLALGVALATLATAVKFPAIVVVGFTVPLFLVGKPRHSPAQLVRLCLIAFVTVVATLALVSWLGGVGLGWTKQVNNAIRVVSFMSLPTMVGIVLRAFFGPAHGPVVDTTVRATRAAGSMVSAVVLTVLWARAVWSPTMAIRLLTTALAVAVVLSPAVQPWYFIWSLMYAATFVVLPRVLQLLAAASIALVLITTPMGAGVGFIAFVAAASLAVLGARALMGPMIERPDVAETPAA